MRALSLHRPWPWAIMLGGKRVENRGWEITFRGDIVFQAAKRFDHDAVPMIQRNSPDGLFCSGEPSAHPAGVLACVVRIVDCLRIEDFGLLAATNAAEWMATQRQWAFGPWCTIFDDVRPLSPLPCKGHQGWFDVPDAVVADALAGHA